MSELPVCEFRPVSSSYPVHVTENSDVYVVVPMLNEEAVIADVVSDLRESFSHVICVDDGSHDGSAAVAGAAGAVVIRHPDNLGQGAAIQTGISFALRDPGMRYVITFDGDGQHRPSDAVGILETARSSGVDVVLGSRFLSPEVGSMPARRRLLLRGAIAFTRLTTRLKLTDAHNGLRAFNRRAATRVQVTLNGMAHASEILQQIASNGLSYQEHPITVEYTAYSRAKGQSNINAVNIVFDLLAARLRTGR